MGAKCSRKVGDDRPVIDLDTGQLSSAEFKLDRDLHSFHSILRRQNKRVINTVDSGVDVRAVSLDSLRDVTENLLAMDQQVVKVILDCPDDILKTAELSELVEHYFDNSLETLGFCTCLGKCLKKARDSKLIPWVSALQEFEKHDGFKENKYMEELKIFRDAGYQFWNDFIEHFQIVCQNQLLILKKLQSQTKKVDKKLKFAKRWRKISKFLFSATFTAIVISAVVAAVMAAPPVAAALTVATTIPIGAAGKWFDSIWQSYEDGLKEQKHVMDSMQVGTQIAIKDVEGLEMKILALMENADFALRQEKSVRTGVEEMKKKLESLMKSVEDLTEQTDRCSQDVGKARTVVLQQIIKHPDN